MPQRAILEDLTKEIVQWINQGNHIILVINLNCHVIDSEEATILRNIGLFEAITDKYSDLALGPTH